MKKLFCLIFSALMLMSFPSCGEDKLPTEDLGKVSYYPKFLFWDADTTSVTKTFSFDFNDDALALGTGAYAEFAFVDVDGKLVPTNELEIRENGKPLSQNRFKVDAANPSKTLTFIFLPAAKSGTHQGCLKLVGTKKLERLCSYDLAETASPELFKWSLRFEKDWNPLAKVLFALALFISAGLSLWFGIFKRVVCPLLRINRIQITCDAERYFVDKRVRGYRKVVMTEHPAKQSRLSKQFYGEILYINSHQGLWSEEWQILPYKRIASVDLQQHYMIKPVVLELEPFKDYTLTQLSTKKSIKIKLL